LIQECVRLSKHDAQFRIMTDVPEVADYQLALLSDHPSFVMEYAEYCGEHDPAWKDTLSGISLQEYNADIWSLPMTDQEIFSRKKHIPYLRVSYRIQKI
jgi:hypothetical protein